MTTIARGGGSGTKTIRWFARGISVLVVMFWVMMLIGHLFGEEEVGTVTRREWAMLAVMITLVTASAAGLIVGWWRERAGGTIVATCGVLLFISLLLGVGRNELYVASVVSVPFLTPGILFLICSRASTLVRSPAEGGAQESG